MAGYRLMVFVLLVKAAFVQNAPVDDSELIRISESVAPTLNVHLSGPIRAIRESVGDSFEEKRIEDVDATSILVARLKYGELTDDEFRGKMNVAFVGVFDEKLKDRTTPVSLTFVTGIKNAETAIVASEPKDVSPDEDGKKIYFIVKLNALDMDTNLVLKKKDDIQKALKKSDIDMKSLESYVANDNKDDDDSDKHDNDNDDDGDKKKKGGKGLAIGLSILGVVAVVAIVAAVVMIRKRNA